MSGSQARMVSWSRKAPGATIAKCSPSFAHGDQKRPGDVVPAVADEGEAGALPSSKLLFERHEVGKRLRRVVEVGEPVVDGHAGVGGELLHRSRAGSPGTRWRRTCGPARARCLRRSPSPRAGYRSCSGRSDARPPRRRPSRRRTGSGWRSSRRSWQASCPRSAACRARPRAPACTRAPGRAGARSPRARTPATRGATVPPGSPPYQPPP